MYCLAIDIGASGGRHILGEIIYNEIKMTTIYRFDNSIKNTDGQLCWDMEYITEQVLKGIKACGEKGVIPDSIAIDTWGVDYVLLDENKKEVLPVVSYRDNRTTGIPEEIDGIISKEKLYLQNGIQRVNFNTLYQLYCDKLSGKMDKAEYFLMIPEYLTFKLTGVICNEYTAASTTGLLNVESRTWDENIIASLGLKRRIFGKIRMPRSLVGKFTDEVEKYVGFNTRVLFAPSHDTASAVEACALKGRGMYISSGTWSLVGILNRRPVLTPEAMNANFTNEGGVDNTYRFLKNIMGMWLFQNIRKNLDKKYSYDEMMNMAMKSNFKQTFDPNDARLVAPENMIEAVRECLGRPDLPLADVISSVYHSLANSYLKVVKEIERITGERIDSINIVGGGSKDVYLNSLTEKYTGKPVIAGPAEATAMGNLKSQFKQILGNAGL
ncbi:MAG: rhamnulokinase [Clostridia bacterium]|nr:rhamnulokinase [Clostridia bacterium]